MGSEIENEFINYDKYNAWGPVYQELKNEAAMQAIENEFSTAEARNAANRNKNRYRDVSPYDHARVKLSNNVYINASLVEVKQANRKYILTQGPLEVTVSHFWQMVWEQESKAIIMLNKLIENGARKCYKYYPTTDEEDEEEEMEFEDVSLNVSVIRERQLDYYIERILLLKHTESGESREVIHYNYTHWPDFGVPQSPLVFLNFLMTVRQSGALEADVGPAIIHCSAGIGRSGTFCLVDSALVIIEKTQDMNSIDVRSLLLEMRSYRMGLIQTADQLRFSYLAIIDGGRRILSNGNSTLDILSDYLDHSSKKEDTPPPPPERTTSLPVEKHPPPLPPRQDLKKTEDKEEEEEEDYENHPILTEDTEELIPEKKEEENGAFRRRIQREERRQKTQNQIDRMREKQRKSELWRNRRSYLTPVAIGITLLIGGFILYKYYF